MAKERMGDSMSISDMAQMGGMARADKLSPERRKEISQMGIDALRAKRKTKQK